MRVQHSFQTDESENKTDGLVKMDERLGIRIFEILLQISVCSASVI